MINILYLIDSISNINGGTEGQLKMLLDRIDRTQYNPHLVCLRETKWTQNSNWNVPFKIMHVDKLIHPSIISGLMGFRKYCRENHIDIVQTYFHDSLIFGALAGRFAGVPNIIASRRNLGPGFWNDRKYLRAFRLVGHFITRQMTNSEATKESIVKFERINPDKIDVIYNGLDFARFEAIDERLRFKTRESLGIEKKDILIGMVSHLRREKNIPLFINTANLISQKFPNARFILIGEGRERPDVERQVKELCLGAKFAIAGSIDNVVPYLAAMDIACLTSDGESFSNSIIEYMIAGLPVVATAVGGNIEAVSNFGILFPPGDQNKFEEILSDLIDNGELRKQIGERGKNEARARYSAERMVEGHIRMYERCINGR